MSEAVTTSADAYNKRIYETQYSASHMMPGARTAYDHEMVALRFRVLEPYAIGTRIVDFGCGTGSYLLPLARRAREAVGIDFSRHFLDELRTIVAREGRSNVRVLEEDLKETSLESGAYDLAFSIATLYSVPSPERALQEMYRVLRPGGIAMFELGNRWSVNTIASRYLHTGIRMHSMSVPAMRRIITGIGFQITTHRSFQLLPMYGVPRFLFPFVASQWKIPMGWKVRGRMLDEHISSLSLFRSIAFRHVFLCVKR